MKIFMTGATGFIGSNLLKALDNGKNQIFCTTRKIDKSRIISSPNISWLEGNINSNWTKELEKSEILIHLAATGVTENKNNWQKCFEVNMNQSLDLFLNAGKSKVRRIICIGSGFEYGQSTTRYEYIPSDAPLEPQYAYPASKAALSSAAWGIGVEYKIEMVILRPFYIYGPGENESRFWPQLIKHGKEGKNFYMTKGEQVRDFQHIDDGVKEILFWCNEGKLEKGCPKIINLGSGEICSLKSFAKKEWKRINAKGELIFGKYDYRENELMRFVPKLNN